MLEIIIDSIITILFLLSIHYLLRRFLSTIITYEKSEDRRFEWICNEISYLSTVIENKK